MEVTQTITPDLIRREIQQITKLSVQFMNSVSNGNAGKQDVMQLPNIINARKQELMTRLAASSSDYPPYTFEWLYVQEFAKIIKDLRLKTIIVLDKDGETCGICLEEMKEGCETKAMECMHRFHPDCIAKWLDRKKDTCPFCRGGFKK